MKLRSVVSAVAAALCAASWLTAGARAQSLPPPAPPAYVVAQRLAGQAQAATAYAGALAQSGRGADASFQRGIAHSRALQAVRKYQAVVSSATYRKTGWAAEALFQQAHLQEDFLDNKNAAVQAYQTIHNTLAGVPFPDQKYLDGNMTRIEREIDYQSQHVQPGMFGWLAPILYRVIDFMVKLCGGPKFSYSYALAILLISVLVKLALTPLSNKQYASMKEMQKLQPVVKEIQNKYKNDKEAQGRKVMEVYKVHGVNPAAGCLPMLVQLPILYMLYYMIRLYQYQFQNGQFLWIGSPLSHVYPSFLGINLGQPDIPILLLYALSMYVQQKMMVSPDPQQAEQQKMMAYLTPFMTTYFFLQYHLPSAFVLYYLVFNILSTVQQRHYMQQRAVDAGDGDGGSKVKGGDLPLLPNGGGSAKPRPNGANGSNNGGSRRIGPGRDVPIAEAKEEGATAGKNGDKFSRPSQNGNGAAPSARGVIAPAKIHPKKKRR